MKKTVFLLMGVATLMAFQACQDSTAVNGIESIKDSTTEIRFTNYVNSLTRASRDKGNSFQDYDTIEVYGYQSQNPDPLFNHQRVINLQGWYYTPVKYWEKNSTYDFYAIFPYNYPVNSFNRDTRLFSVSSFTVKEAAADQIDLMIAKQITGHLPYNVVPFEFNHILSNVSFYLKTADEFSTDGIVGVKVINFDITGLYGEGSFAQTGWDNNNVFVGDWTPVETSEYDLPAVKDSVYLVGATKAQTVVNDLLLLPQQINDNAKVTITFQLMYEDETASVFTRTVALNKIVGTRKSDPTKSITLAKWDPNFRYNYTISVNPAITDQGGHHLPIANDEHSQEQFENTDSITPNINIIEIDNDGDGIPDEWWIDSDLDDQPDYPIIWQDIDGDGKEEGLPDRDGDGEPDHTNGTDDPDVIWQDTDGDGVVDTELERDKTTPGDIDPGLPSDTTDTNYPDTCYVDYDGAETGGYKQPTSWLVTDADGEFWVDTHNDGQGDIKVVWKDVDGDGLLEGIADKDGDGKATENDNYDGDHKDYLDNDNEFDVILYAHVIKNDDGTEDYEKDEEGNTKWYELEKKAPTPDVQEVTTEIQFSATVVDWNDDYNAEYIIKE